MTRVAVLDDYQSVALSMADWDRLPPDTKVEAFSDHIDDEDALAARLEPFDVVVAMRETDAVPTLAAVAAAEPQAAGDHRRPQRVD